VTSADRDASRRAGLTHVEHQRGDGDDAHVDGRAAHAEQTGDCGLRQHLAGGPRVGADEDGARAAVGPERRGEAGDELRRERFPDYAADAQRSNLQGQGLPHRLNSVRARR
jgi:hypothetical protein